MQDSFLVTSSFIRTIHAEARPVRKTVRIRAVELQENKTVISKEGKESGQTGDFFVTENGDAVAGYLIKRETFHQMYEYIEGDCYEKRDICLAYLMGKPFAVMPTWNNGEFLCSSPEGGYLMLYGENDFNICSFEDFEKTYEFV